MAVLSVVNYADKRELRFPVSGAGANLPVGTLLMPGVSAGTNVGVLIPITAASNANVLGVLNAPHNYAASGDALTATLTQWFPLDGFAGASYLQGNIISPTAINFPSHAVDLIDTAVLTRVSYNLTTTAMPVASYVAASTTLTITNEITGKDSAFDYINAGPGAGQLAFVTVSNAGSDTIATGFATAPTAASYVTQVLPLFYRLPVWKVNTTVVPNTFDSTAAVGTGRALMVANFISLNGDVFSLDPYVFNGRSGLNSLAAFDLFTYCALQSSAFHPIS